jgi:aminoglycoside 2'-N-acetyltransferase I
MQTAMPSIQTAHTSDLPPDTLAAARHLLDAVFDDMTDEDWEHSLGGIHALAWDGPTLVGHSAVVQRRMVHRARALRTGYVEGVGVHPHHRRRGHGAAMMRALEHVVRNAYDIGVLAATDEGMPFYTALGWTHWRGTISALSPAGIIPTPEEADCIYVLPVTTDLDHAAGLTCDWRDGDLW